MYTGVERLSKDDRGRRGVDSQREGLGDLIDVFSLPENMAVLLHVNRNCSKGGSRTQNIVQSPISYLMEPTLNVSLILIIMTKTSARCIGDYTVQNRRNFKQSVTCSHFFPGLWSKLFFVHPSPI